MLFNISHHTRGADREKLFPSRLTHTSPGIFNKAFLTGGFYAGNRRGGTELTTLLTREKVGS